MKKARQFTVRGRGPFPLDMLRYDRCYPYSQVDSRVLELSLTDNDRSAWLTVTLETGESGAPTVSRWTEFGWWVDASA